MWNSVIAGDYKGQGVMVSGGTAKITLPMVKTVKITKDTVEEYEVINKDTKLNTASVVTSSLVGSFFFGPAGAAFALSAKKDSEYQIAIQFRDGKKSLLNVDGKTYKAIMKGMF